MAAPVPPAHQHLPATRAADANLRLHEQADGILRRFVRSPVIPTQAVVKGDAPPAPAAPPALFEDDAPNPLAGARTLADLQRLQKPVPTPAPARPAPPVVETDGWHPRDVLARGGAPTKPRSGASLAASALAKLRPKG